MSSLRTYQLLAEQMLHEHGLNDWKFQWDNARTRGGICKYSIKTIQVSRVVAQLNDDDWFYQTLIHEVAHALVGPGHGHGYVWRNKMRALGARPNRTHNGTVVKEKHKFIYTCPKCGIFGSRARQSNYVVCRKDRTYVQWFRVVDQVRIDRHSGQTIFSKDEIISIAKDMNLL